MKNQTNYFSKTINGVDFCSCCKRNLTRKDFKLCDTKESPYFYTRCFCGVEQFKVIKTNVTRC